jgi:hypothetical protein
MWRITWRGTDAPSARAASTNSFSRSEKNCARTSRATGIQQQGQLRQRQEQVGQPHQRRVDGAARDAGDGADGDADEHRHQHRRQADGQRDAAAVEHAREDVLAEVVGAEGMRRGRRLQARREVDLVDRELPEQRSEAHHQDHDRQDDEAGDGELVPAEAPPRLGPRRDVARALHGRRQGRRDGRHASDS